MGRDDSVPMMGGRSLDLDDYVTNKSLDGFFYMVEEEKKKIRNRPQYGLAEDRFRQVIDGWMLGCAFRRGQPG